MTQNNDTSHGMATVLAARRARLRSVLVLMLPFTALAACDLTTESTWQEEVKFRDGRVITVTRTIVWKESRPIGQSKDYIAREVTLSFAPGPEQGSTHWRGVREFPLLLDVDTKRHEYIIVTYPGCARYLSAGRPNPPYIQYRLRGGTWTQVEFDLGLVGTKSNMLVYPNVSERELVNLEEKAQRQTRLGLSVRNLRSTGKRC